MSMQCNHCAVCAASNKCTKTHHVCGFRNLIEREALKDIKPVKWKIKERK